MMWPPGGDCKPSPSCSYLNVTWVIAILMHGFTNVYFKTTSDHNLMMETHFNMNVLVLGLLGFFWSSPVGGAR